MITCCSGIYGAPALSEQAPGNIVIDCAPPRTLLGWPVGTRVYAQAPAPVWVIEQEPPLSAVLHCGRVSTTSRQCGARPAPIPAVGTRAPSPTLPCQVSSCEVTSVAPQPKRSTGFVFVVAIIIALWVFAGALTRRFL